MCVCVRVVSVCVYVRVCAGCVCMRVCARVRVCVVVCVQRLEENIRCPAPSPPSVFS